MLKTWRKSRILPPRRWVVLYLSIESTILYWAYSFPPSSLDDRSTELIASPKKVVWYRGGSRYVEGCWGVPHLEIQKFPNCHFMFLIDMKFVSKILKNSWRGYSSSSGANFQNFNCSKCISFKLQISKFRTFKISNVELQASKISKFSHSKISKIIE